jgi:hypothetical protein
MALIVEPMSNQPYTVEFIQLTAKTVVWRIQGPNGFVLHCPGDLVALAQSTHSEAVQRQMHTMISDLKKTC